FSNTSVKPAGPGIWNWRGFQFDGIVLLRICHRIPAVIPAHHTHGHALGQGELFASIDSGTSIRRNLLCHYLIARGYRTDDTGASQPGPCRRIEGMIEVAVSSKQEVDRGSSADRLHHSSDSSNIRLKRIVGLSQPASSSIELALWYAADVTVCHDFQGTDFVIHVRDGHPGHIHVRRRRCGSQRKYPHCSQGDNANPHPPAHERV